MPRKGPFDGFFDGDTELAVTFEIRPRGLDAPLYMTNHDRAIPSDVKDLPAGLITGIWEGGEALYKNPRDKTGSLPKSLPADAYKSLSGRKAETSTYVYDSLLIHKSAFDKPRVYQANVGFTQAALEFTWDLDPANTDLDGLDEKGRDYVQGRTDADSGLTPDLLETGACDGAPVIVGVISHKFPKYGPLPLFTGRVETVEYRPYVNEYQLGLRSYKELLRVASNKAYSRVCRARLGDGDCRMKNFHGLTDTQARDYYFNNRNSDENTMYGAKRFESRWMVTESNQLAPRLKPIKDAVAPEDGVVPESERGNAVDVNTFSEHKTRMDKRFPGKDWFKGGHAKLVKDGLLMDLGDAQVDEFNKAALLSEHGDYPLPTALPPPRPLEVGEVVYMYPGCAKTLVACDNWFHNSDNFRGEPSRYAPKTSPELLEDVEDGNVEIRYYAKPRFGPSDLVTAGPMVFRGNSDRVFGIIVASEPTGEDPPYEDWEWNFQVKEVTPAASFPSDKVGGEIWYGVVPPREGTLEHRLLNGVVLSPARPKRQWSIVFTASRLRRLGFTLPGRGQGDLVFELRLRARARKLNSPRAKWSDWVQTPESVPLTVTVKARV